MSENKGTRLKLHKNEKSKGITKCMNIRKLRKPTKLINAVW